MNHSNCTFSLEAALTVFELKMYSKKVYKSFRSLYIKRNKSQDWCNATQSRCSKLKTAVSKMFNRNIQAIVLTLIFTGKVFNKALLDYKSLFTDACF